jgi:thiol-disulfide isomerase/thioredoxin
MSYLVAAVTLVGAICLVDLLLTVGVIRRLRTHAELLSRLPAQGLELPEGPPLAVGSRPADFTATTTAGEPVTQASLGAQTVLGFFMSQCQPCSELLPQFVRYAAELPASYPRPLAVVVGDDGQAAEYAQRLSQVARVVTEPAFGTVSTAFSVRGFPAVAILDDQGTVAAAGSRLLDLPAPATT